MRTHRLLIALAVVALAVSSGAWAGGEVNLWYGQKNLDLGSQAAAFQSDVASNFDEFTRTGSDTFIDLEDLGQFGLMTSWGLDWPVALAADFFYANNDVSLSYSGTYEYYIETEGRQTIDFDVTDRAKIDYTAWELDLGIRKYWGGKAQFYLGTGLAFGGATADVSGATNYSNGISRQIGPEDEAFSESVSGSDYGLWADIGVVWRAGEHFNLGLDLRYSAVNVDLEFEDSDPERFPAGGTQVGLFIGGRW